MDNPRKMSYLELTRIITDIISTDRYCDYSEASERNSFIILRHDIEFFPDCALDMQKIENRFGLKSSYFFQISNNSYNPFSKRNMDIIKEIHSNGHHIGLHYHLNGKTDLNDITSDIGKQAIIMSEMLNIEIDRFSFHRPTNAVLRANIDINGLINTYSPQFFTFMETYNAQAQINVKYIADSDHTWKYGYPSLMTLMEYDKIQILLHPYSWTEYGYDTLDNFAFLINGINTALIDTINNECTYYKEAQDAL